MARTKLKLKSIASGTIPGRIKIANENITAGSVGTVQLAAGSVDSDAMGAGAISPAKLSAIAQRGGGGNKNFFINGAMSVAQRATSSTGLGTTAGYYTTDRWHIALNANTAGRLTMTQDNSAPSGFANSTKLACTTADTSIASGEQVIFQQKIEGQNLQSIAKGTSDAKPLTLSFYVKGNASATYVAGLYDTDNNRYIGSTFNVTTNWTRVEINFPADTTGELDDDNGSSLELWIWLHAGTTYTSGSLQTSWGSSSNPTFAGGLSSSFFDSTDRTFFITGVQLEIGNVATEFEHEPAERTEMKCYRYYFKSSTYTLALANAHTVGYSFRQERTQQHVMPVKMRSSPTATAVESAKLLSSGTITLHANTDHIVIYPSAHSADLPSAEYWYGGYTADAEL